MVQIKDLTYSQGKMSTFGSVKDRSREKNDNLAYMAFDPKSRNHDVYLQFFHSIADYPWFRGVFISDEEVKKSPSQWGLMGYLSPHALYHAARYKYGKRNNKPGNKLWNQNNPFLTFINPKNGKKVTTQRVDYGPGFQTGRHFDLSHTAADHIGLKTDDFTKARPATAEEILATKTYHMSLAGSTSPVIIHEDKKKIMKAGIGGSSWMSPLLIVGIAFAGAMIFKK
jgi:hypothetical protein